MSNVHGERAYYVYMGGRTPIFSEFTANAQALCDTREIVRVGSTTGGNHDSIGVNKRGDGTWEPVLLTDASEWREFLFN